MSYLEQYLQDHASNIKPQMVAYLSNLDLVNQVEPMVAQNIVRELEDQRTHLKMIASENYSSPAVQATMGNLLTDKYAEGFPHHRFYAGCDNIDAIEARACDLAKELFGADHAYVQAHSGADANLLAYWVILSKKIQEPRLEAMGITDPAKLEEADWDKLREELGNQKLIGLNYYSGGHLTHGYRHNISSRMFRCYSYDVDPKTELLDYDHLRELVLKEKPFIFWQVTVLTQEKSISKN